MHSKGAKLGIPVTHPLYYVSERLHVYIKSEQKL